MKMNKSDRCLRELRNILEIEGLDRKSAKKARSEALEAWIDRWVYQVEIKQSIIKSNFTSEEMDFIKYHTAKVASEALMEDCISLDLNEKEIKLSLKALRI